MLPEHLSLLWGHDGPTHDYTRWSRRRFGTRVQKISLNQGGTCPNRDGTLGSGGCSFCRVDSFTPDYCFSGNDLAGQFAKGRDFFAHKYPDQACLAYLQSYSNTYCDPAELRSTLESLSGLEGCAGIVVGTRPDLVGPDHVAVLARIADRGVPLFVELGIESTLDRSLLAMNRGHDFGASVEAAERLAAAGIFPGAHLILGLPGESRTDMLSHADRLNALPILSLKLHHLQVLQGSSLAREWEDHPEQFPYFSPSAYAELCADFLERLRPDIVIERYANESPPNMVLFPSWDGVRNYQMTSMVTKVLLERGSHQGRIWLGEAAT